VRFSVDQIVDYSVYGLCEVSDLPEVSLAAIHQTIGRRGRGTGRDELEKLVVTLEEEIFAAAEELRFEYAVKLRDEIKDLRRELAAAAESAA
jgi:excinuclease UvrABC helicase subunit UvrB